MGCNQSGPKEREDWEVRIQAGACSEIIVFGRPIADQVSNIVLRKEICDADGSDRDLVRFQHEIIVPRLLLNPHPWVIAREPRPSMSSSQRRNRETRHVWTRSWRTSLPLGIFHCHKKYTSCNKFGSHGKNDSVDLVEAFVVIYQGPSWLTEYAWMLRASRAVTGWTFSPRAYNVVPVNALMFQYVRANDVEAVQGLFTSKQASPFDCTRDHYTPLQVCANRSATNVHSLI